MAHNRGRSPVHRVASAVYDTAMRIDSLGNADNPYARFGEFLEEKVHGPTARAYDGNEHRVEVLQWSRIIDARLARIGKHKTLHVGRHYLLENGSVNFVIEDMTESDMKAVGQIAYELPAGCTLFLGDATSGSVQSDDSVARRPRDSKFFITVTERAQSNLESRRASGARTALYDRCFLTVALVLMLVCGFLLVKHHENHSDPWSVLTESASEKLTLTT